MRTCTNSIGVFSPMERDTDARVAGNALGTMLIEVRFRGLEMTSEEMDTVRRKTGRSALIQQSGETADPDPVRCFGFDLGDS